MNTWKLKPKKDNWKLMYCRDGFIEGIECDDVKLKVIARFDSKKEGEAYCNNLIGALTSAYEVKYERKKVSNFF